MSKINPRYFTDKSEKAVYLTGSFTWNALVEMVPGQSQEVFDFKSYIQWMKEYNHNFIRLFTWELLNWDTQANREKQAQNLNVSPHRWARTGPGYALMAS